VSISKDLERDVVDYFKISL